MSFVYASAGAWIEGPSLHRLFLPEEIEQRRARWYEEHEEAEVGPSPESIAKAQAFWAEYLALEAKYEGVEYDSEYGYVTVDGKEVLESDGDSGMVPKTRKVWRRRDTGEVVA